MSKHTHHHYDGRPRREQFIEGRSGGRVSWNSVIVAAAALFLGVAILVAARGSGSAAGSLGKVIGDGRTDVIVNMASLADGKAQFFRYRTASNREARFFVMRSSDGVVRAALDACTICYQKGRGYRQVGDNMVCNECSKAFPSTDINVITGGCNPIPVDRSVEGDRVIVRAAALEAGAAYF